MSRIVAISIAVVIALHVALLGWLWLGSRRGTPAAAGSSGAGAAAKTAGPRRLGQPGPGKPGRAEAGNAGTNRESAAETERQVLPGHCLFRRGLKPLPATLRAKTRECREGVLVLRESGRILWEKAAEKPGAIASLTKMMTALLLAERIRTDPALSWTTPVRVTRAAARIGGSQVYLDPRETFTLGELLRCIMIFSANDAAYLVAEYLGGGKVGDFVSTMNRRARELGLRHTRYYTPNGLADSRGRENVSTPLDQAVLTERLLDYPEVVRDASTWISEIREKTGKPFRLVNRNRLVHDCPGVIGMKTGFTRKAGFCVAAVCRRDGRTAIAVLMGCRSSRRRNALAAALFDWALGPGRKPQAARKGRSGKRR